MMDLIPAPAPPVEAQGMYVGYVVPVADGLPCERVLLMWIGGKWSYPSSDQTYRGEVYGYVGPLPHLRAPE